MKTNSSLNATEHSPRRTLPLTNSQHDRQYGRQLEAEYFSAKQVEDGLHEESVEEVRGRKRHTHRQQARQIRRELRLANVG